MISAKEFAFWLAEQLRNEPGGVYLTREDIKQLTGRLNYRSDFINDIHFELVSHGMGFVSDSQRSKFYLVHLPDRHWQQLPQNLETGSDDTPPPLSPDAYQSQSLDPD